MTVSEMDVYMNVVDNIEDRVEDDNKYPVIKDNKIKICCKYALGALKILIYNVKHYIDAKKEK